jgi:hypothetical protein
MLKIKAAAPWARRFVKRSLFLAGTTTLLWFSAFVPTLNAQVVLSITPPSCAYGYYGYAPYGCAPSGYYGPGYFYGGVFLGVGPWANWGYGHGWGSHRFSGARGGSYRGVRGNDGRRGYVGNRGHGQVVRTNHASATVRNSHAAAARGHESHGAASHGGEGHGGQEHK